jgi:uncharacterized delta-60 repeat protein
MHSPPTTPLRNAIFSGHTAAVWVAAGLLCLLSQSEIFAQAGSVDPTFSTNKFATFPHIDAVDLQSDGKVLIAYSLDPHPNIARLDTNGNLDPSFNIGTGLMSPPIFGLSLISLMRVLPDDSIFVGGQFDGFNGTNCPNLVHLHPDGSLDLAYQPHATNYSGLKVSPMGVESGNRVLMIANGSPARIWRLDATGALDDTFKPFTINDTAGGAMPQTIKTPTTCISDRDEIVMAVNYVAPSVPWGWLARLHPTGGWDTQFAQVVQGQGVFGNAFGLQVDGKILFGGAFTNYADSGRNRIVRLNPDDSVDSSFDPGSGPDGTVRAIALQPDGRILICGDFTHYNGIPAASVARLFPDGGLDSTFDVGSGPDGSVLAMAVTRNGSVLITGSFKNVNGVPASNHIARLNADPPTVPSFARCPANTQAVAGRTFRFSVNVAGAQPLSYQWKFNNVEIAGATNDFLAFDSLDLTNAGNYSVLVTNSRGPITSTNAMLTVTRAPVSAGSADVAYGAQADGSIYSMATQTNDGKVVIAGLFRHINGQIRNNVARLNTDGTLDNSFDPGLGPDNTPYALAVQPDGKILVGGSFSNFNGVARTCVARLNTSGSVDTSFVPPSISYSSILGVVYRIAVRADGKIFVGGSFTRVNGNSWFSLARLSSSGAFDSAFSPSSLSSRTVNSLLPQPDGKILVGAARLLTLLGTNGAADSSFQPPAIPANVQALAMQADGKILAGLSGSSSLMRFNPNGSQDTNFSFASHYGTCQDVRIQSDGKIVAAGNAISNGVPSANIVRVNPDGTVDGTFAGVTDGEIDAMVLTPNGKALIGGQFVGVDGCPRYGLAHLNADVRILSATYDGAAFHAQLQMDLGKNYFLEFNNDLRGPAWQSLPVQPGHGLMETLSDPATVPAQRFYRVRVE